MMLTLLLDVKLMNYMSTIHIIVQLSDGVKLLLDTIKFQKIK